MKPPSRRPLVIVSPPSLRTWYHIFADPGAPVLFVGEAPTATGVTIDEITDVASGAEIHMVSSHVTLRRDLALADELRAHGMVVRVQSRRAVAAGLDKVVAKRILTMRGLPVPRWGVDAPAASSIERLLTKGRNSTQSEQVDWAENARLWGPDVYWEEYVDGVEFSVVLYRQDKCTILLPPVWKGPTQRDLLPPWQRLRVCPVPHEYTATVQALLNLADEVAAALDAWGFVEVEFIVSEDRGPQILEVNPRISGTLRLAAMATGIQVFDLGQLCGAPARPVARHWAAELPYRGNPFAAPEAVGTSRVTCVAGSPAEARAALESWAPAEIVRSTLWPHGWQR